MIEFSLLQHEHQLGETLNQCVHNDKRAEFSLLLAMLNEDAREQSQFLMPQTEAEQKDVTEDSLRAEFELPQQQALGLTNLEQLHQYNQSAIANDRLTASLKLADALNPKPLSFRDDKKHVPTEIMANTSLHCQVRAERQEQESQNTRLSMNAKAWLKSLQNAYAHSQQIEMAAQVA